MVVVLGFSAPIEDVIHVLHSFHKKSKRHISTPKPDVDLIRGRIRRAEEHYAEWSHKRGAVIMIGEIRVEKNSGKCSPISIIPMLRALTKARLAQRLTEIIEAQNLTRTQAASMISPKSES